MHKWTLKELQAARAALAGHHTAAEGMVAVSTKLGRKVTSDSLAAALRRHGLGNIDDAMRKGRKGPPADPVARRETKEASTRAKQEHDAMVSEVRAFRERQKFLDKVEAVRAPPRILPREKTSGMRELTAVAMASDWHVEETVRPETIAGLNSYNLDIADHRIDRFFRGIIWNVEHHRASRRLAIRDLVLWLGGDLITGFIHDELIESNSLHPMEAVLWLQPRLRDGIATLREHLGLDHIEVVCSHGNHSRTTRKVHVANGHKHSYEWLMYNTLAREFEKEPRVHFEITGSRHQYVQVYDKVLHFHHGDELKYQGGVGGLGIPLLKRVPAWDLVKRADVHCIGHWHQLLDYGRAVVNGSLIGYNAFAQSIGASPEPPQQALFYMDKVRGKCMTTALWVSDAKAAA